MISKIVTSAAVQAGVQLYRKVYNPHGPMSCTDNCSTNQCSGEND